MTTTPSRDGQNPSDILRLDSFESAFATGPELQNTQRRFKTLVVERPSTQQLGGTSYVCRATTTDGLVLAVKRMLPATQADPQEQRDSKAVGQASLFQEYKALLTVSGKPGFPLVYGYGYSEGGPMILMEWVRGQTLHEAEEAMPHDGAGVRADVVCDLGTAVLRVLLNAGGPDGALVHRDISSRNIMLCTDAHSIQQQVEQLSFDVVLIDFGSSALPVRTDSALTVSGLMRFGTPAYAPPEMLTSDVPVPEEVRRSPLVDVYALCSVLYELYSGRVPFQTHGSYYLEKTTKAPAPLVPHHEADRQLCAYILGGIRQNPQSRPDTRELLGQLESWLRSQGLPVAGGMSFLPAQEPQAPSPGAKGGQEGHERPRSLTRRALLAGVGVACAAGAFFAWQAFAKDGPMDLLGSTGTDGQQDTSASDTTDEDGLVQQADDHTSSAQDGATFASALGNVAFAWPALDASTNLWGLAQTDGSWLVEPRFASQPCSWSSYGTPAYDGSAGLWGICAEDGTWAVQPQFARLGPLSADGLAAARASSGSWGIVDASGSWVVQPAYLNMGLVVSQDMVCATSSSSQSSWGMLGKGGSWALQPNGYSTLGTCADNGLVAACVNSYLWGYVRANGQGWAIQPTLAEARMFAGGVAACRPNQSDATWTLIDASANRLVEGLADVRPFSEGLAAAKNAQSDTWGLVDQKGSWVVSPSFAQMGDVHDGLAAAKDAQSGLWGLVDTTGAWRVQPAFAAMAMGCLESDQPGAA